MLDALKETTFTEEGKCSGRNKKQFYAHPKIAYKEGCKQLWAL